MDKVRSTLYGVHFALQGLHDHYLHAPDERRIHAGQFVVSMTVTI
jgi:hypothetical protein